MLKSRFVKRMGGGDSGEERQLTCTIRFLDDSEPLSLAYQKDANGKQLFDQVCEGLDLLEKDYFGLRFVDSEKQRHWLDLSKPIYRQLKHVRPAMLCFRVKFYPSDPTKLREEITRYFLFLQLRRDLHHGRLLCQLADANLLAAYIIQSEIGDYDPDEHLVDYVGKFKMLPKQTQRQEEKITELHRTLAGQVPSDAEMNFLRKATGLDTYGVDPHPVKDQIGSQMYLGVTRLGIVTFQGSKRTRLFEWNQITKITFEGKVFIVHATISDDEMSDEKHHFLKKKKHAVGYKCPTLAACKHLWKCAVEQQIFFTHRSTSEVPIVSSGGGLFSRGSKFRFSGRCEREAYSDFILERDEPPRFNRTSSNPQFAQRYSSLRSGSVPTTFNVLGLSDESLDSLTNGRETHWRSLDDFSRTSTPRRPMKLADHMIPEESLADMRTPSVRQDSLQPRFFADENGYAAPSSIDTPPSNGYGSSSSGPSDNVRHRRIQPKTESGVGSAEDNKGISSSQHLQEHLTTGGATGAEEQFLSLSGEQMINNGSVLTSTSGESGSSSAAGQSSYFFAIIFWAFIFTVFLLAFAVFIFTVFFMDSGIDLGGARLQSSLNDIPSSEIER